MLLSQGFPEEIRRCASRFSISRSPWWTARTASRSATPSRSPNTARGWADSLWVSEHHNHGTIAGTAPEILIAAIAGHTARIRVGSAGMMLPHYSPLKVAEQFRVLDAIAPGRIDLRLGRAPGSDGRTAFALNPLANERPAHFPQRRARPHGVGDGRTAAGRASVRP